MITPERAARLTMRGYQYHKRGQLREALELYQRVLREAPGYPDAWHHAALATRQLCAHARNKGLEAPWDASTLLMVRALEEAVRIVEQVTAEGNPERVVQVSKLYAAMVFNFGWFQQDRGILEGDAGARVMYETATQIDPELGEAWTNLGNVYGELGNRMRSEACWIRALMLPTPTPEATFNLSFLKLRRGQWREGWQMYEARWESPVFLVSYGRPEITAPKWDGSPMLEFDDNTAARDCWEGSLLLHGEQGAGDVIMMARWIPEVAARCQRVVVEVPQPLVHLFAFTYGPDSPYVNEQGLGHVEVVERGSPLRDCDAQLPMMSLPAIFGATPETLPEPWPFRLRHRSNPGPSGPLSIESGRIGLCWRGSPTHPGDRTRSMPIDAIAPLLGMTGFTWQSLQFGADEVAGLQPLIATDYLDTAREIAKCELVITVDTSVAHLAASMGVPTWILLPFHAEWRWMEGETTPWYESARLWRQEKPGDWAGVVASVTNELTRRLENAKDHQPVSA